MPTSELNRWWSVVSTVADILMRTIFRVHVEGMSNVPSRGPAIVAFNHVSVIDGPAVGIVVARGKR
ncbi:MAG: 1-acyl-sn-glycerol-3-phosphate acyltransferase, partial [Actinomycetota bacterium]